MRRRSDDGDVPNRRFEVLARLLRFVFLSSLPSFVSCGANEMAQTDFVFQVGRHGEPIPGTFAEWESKPEQVAFCYPYVCTFSLPLPSPSTPTYRSVDPPRSRHLPNSHRDPKRLHRSPRSSHPFPPLSFSSFFTDLSLRTTGPIHHRLAHVLNLRRIRHPVPPLSFLCRGSPNPSSRRREIRRGRGPRRSSRQTPSCLDSTGRVSCVA
jgi:hypothetical protein